LPRAVSDKLTVHMLALTSSELHLHCRTGPDTFAASAHEALGIRPASGFARRRNRTDRIVSCQLV